MSITVDKEKTKLLGYKDIFVSVEGSTTDTYNAYIKPSFFQGSECPRCKSTHIQQRGYRSRKVRDILPVGGKEQYVTVIYHQRQYSCSDCKHFFSEKIKHLEFWTIGTEYISLRLKIMIFCLGCNQASSSKIAQRVGLSYRTVEHVQEEMSDTARLPGGFSTGYFLGINPEHLAIRTFSLAHQEYTFFVNLDDGVVCYFAQGDPKSIIRDREREPIMLGLLYKAKVILADANCNYINSLQKFADRFAKELHSSTFTIAHDQKSLFNELYLGLVKISRNVLTAYRHKKFISYIEPLYKDVASSITDQRIFNYIKRTISESSELEKHFLAFSSFRERIGPANESSEPNAYMSKEELTKFLIEKKYLAQEFADSLFDIRTFDNYYKLDDFRKMVSTISEEAATGFNNASPTTIEDNLFYSVPATYKVMNPSMGHDVGSLHKASSFMEQLAGNIDLTYLGRSFKDIEENFFYKKAVAAGERSYVGLWI